MKLIDLFLDLINYDGNAGAVETDKEITKHHCYERRHGFRSELSSNHLKPTIRRNYTFITWICMFSTSVILKNVLMEVFDVKLISVYYI